MTQPASEYGRRYLHAFLFFRILFGALEDAGDGLPHAVVLLRQRLSDGKTVRRTTWYWHIEDAADAAAAAVGEGWNVYFHLALHNFILRRDIAWRKWEPGTREPFSASRSHRGAGRECVVTGFRGNVASAEIVPCLWLDIDYGKAGHEKGLLPPDRESALALITAIGEELLPPSLVIDSGNGFHVYWVLKEPFALKGDDDRDLISKMLRWVERLAAEVAARLGTERGGKPWAIDAVHDLARVLRVPGSRNFKSDPPREVDCCGGSRGRHPIEEFLFHPAILHIASRESASPTDSQQTEVAPTWTHLDSIPELNPSQETALPALLKTRLESDRSFARLWNHECDDEIADSQRRRGRTVDTSHSVYDLRIAALLQRHGWDPASVVWALREHARQRGRDPNAKLADYYLRTVDKSRVRRDSKASKVRVSNDEELAPLAPEPPAPTRGIVHDAAEARRVAAEVATDWVPGTGSLAFAGWPGLGKTTAMAHRLCCGLGAREPGHERGVGVIALPTRDLVMEKLESLREYLADEKLVVTVTESLGRRFDERTRWHCEAGTRQALRAELHRPSCPPCPLIDHCENTPGRFRHSAAVLKAQIAAAKVGTPLLIITTVSQLHWILLDLPEEVPIVLDDAGSLFGLLREVPLRHVDIDSAIEHARQFADARLRENDLTLEGLIHERDVSQRAAERRATARAAMRGALKSAPSIEAAIERAVRFSHLADISRHTIVRVIEKNWDKGPDRVLAALDDPANRSDALHVVLAADLIARVLHALRTLPRKIAHGVRDVIAETVARLPQAYRDALASGLVVAPLDEHGQASWPFEEIAIDDGPDLRPSFADVAIIAAAEAVEGFSPVVIRAQHKRRAKGSPEHVLYLPDHNLIERARKGWVAWLSVGPMPAQLLESLNARAEVALAEPDGMRAIVAQVVERRRKNGDELFLGFGPGDRRPDRPGRADVITRELFRAIESALSDGKREICGISVSKFGAILHLDDHVALGKPEQCAYYGKDHASTDRMEHCELILVRRFCVPFSLIAQMAMGLRRALRIPDSPTTNQMALERRTWQGSPHVEFGTRVPADPLERDMLRFYELHYQLNAVGRCRPLSHTNMGRIIILLVGRPFDWIRPELMSLDPRVIELLGIQFTVAPAVDRVAALIAHTAKQAAEAIERRAAIVKLRSDTPGGSLAELARTLARSPSTIRRDLAIIAADDREATLPPMRGISFYISRRERSVAAADLPTVETIEAWIRDSGARPPSRRTLQRHARRLRDVLNSTRKGPSVFLATRRSDELNSLRLVVAAVENILGTDVESESPVGPTGAGDAKPVIDVLEALSDAWNTCLREPTRKGRRRRGDGQETAA